MRSDGSVFSLFGGTLNTRNWGRSDPRQIRIIYAFD